MNESLKTLYLQEISQARLDFDRDPDYQKYYTQVLALWEGEDLPVPIFHLLEASDFLSFAHAFRLGMRAGLDLCGG